MAVTIIRIKRMVTRMLMLMLMMVRMTLIELSFQENCYWQHRKTHKAHLIKIK